MSIYDELGSERKELQAEWLLPEWYTTAGWQLFKSKYLWAGSPRNQYISIAITAAAYLPDTWSKEVGFRKFFNLLWKGWLSPSTPVLSNMGNPNRGMPVSCSGLYIDDSISGFYKARLETAVLTKNGFGTSGYMGDVRPRGAKCKTGTASGVQPLIEGFIRDMRDVAQGANRRGAFAAYLPMMHGDFDEVCDGLLSHPSDKNIGWCIYDGDVEALKNGDAETLRRYRKILNTRMTTGKGYLFFPDKANRRLPEGMRQAGLEIKASQLCTEVMLPSNNDYTYTCVLSSMNAAKYDEWKDTDAVYWATVFLDCVASDFIKLSEGIPELSKARNFTINARALGLGLCGLHTYFQQNMIPFESLQARFINKEIVQLMEEQSNLASLELAHDLGSPKWCLDGLRNTHRLAIAPTKSTSLIMGGISEGINPDPAMVYTQRTPAGDVRRITPAFWEFLKSKGLNTEDKIKEVNDNFGSVQNVSWMNDEEKKVFKTAFEIDQNVIVDYASARQNYVDQGQSLNLFFDGRANAEYISEVHKKAVLDENILSLYYVYSRAGVSTNQELGQCEACM